MSLIRSGFLAAQAGFRLELQVIESNAGFYIGTRDEGGPVSRESTEYFPNEYTANWSLATGLWTQRQRL